MNRAVKIATGTLFIVADSDDSFAPDALERFKYHWENIPSNTKHLYAGISCLCKDPVTGVVVGDSFPNSPMDSNTLEMSYLYKLKGEKWGCVRTEIYRDIPFPNVKGNFVPEGFIFHTIARTYRSLCVNEALRDYYTDCENALTKPNVISKFRNSQGLYFSLTWEFNNNMDYIFMHCSSITILRKIIARWNFGFMAGLSPIKMITDVHHRMARFLFLMFFVPGFIYYIKCKIEHQYWS